MTKPDYIAHIDSVASRLQLRSTSLEKRILDMWLKYDKRAAVFNYDILSKVSSDFREFSRDFIAILYEVHPSSATEDCEQLRAKNAAYGGSWCARGGTGAFHALARKGDRIVEQLRIYGTFQNARVGDKTESIDDTLGDLRRYLILVESWHVARAMPVPQRISQSDAETPAEAEKRIFDTSDEKDIPF